MPHKRRTSQPLSLCWRYVLRWYHWGSRRSREYLIHQRKDVKTGNTRQFHWGQETVLSTIL